MQDTHLPILDHTVQQTNVWLKTLAAELHLEDRHDAYAALRAVLHALRDRLTPEQAVHLGAQLPILIRGIYFEGWRIAGKPTGDRRVQDFLDRVASELPPMYGRDPMSVTKAVFGLLFERIDPGEVAKVGNALPAPLRALWPPLATR